LKAQNEKADREKKFDGINISPIYQAGYKHYDGI
jgi:hypothetical protein